MKHHPVDYQKLCMMVCQIAKEAGAFIRNEAHSFDRSKVEYKGLNDLVSYVDKSAEQMIVNSLSSLIPGAGFITEENTGIKNSSGFQWIIDPLDGTTNFVHGLPCYCVSIALMNEFELVIGVVYEINASECFYAWQGGQAMMNNEIIKVSGVSHLKQSLIATGFPYTNYSRMKPYMEVFDFCMRNTHGIRRLGSAAADLVYVACGRLEAFYEYGLNSWDVAGGALIVKQAGGIVTDFSGGENYLNGGEIIAANSLMYLEFAAEVRSRFNQ